jgi:outer membrane protein OmpA-like peptidoglycan-associated protein
LGGKGGLDIFKSTRLDNTSWTKWSPPVNLGDTINSNLSDWGFKVATDGQMAYFSKGNTYEDIYAVQLTKAQQPEKVTIIQGKVINDKNNPIETNIVWQNLITGDTIQITRSSPNGSFFATLPPMRGLVGYGVNKEGYLPVNGNVDLRSGSGKTISRRDSVVIVIASIESAIKKGMALPLNNLFFETAKYDILPESFAELNRWAEIIQNNNLKIEIQGHTDNVGNVGSNEALSQNRANSVRTYLISKGCKENQLIANGFGETKPLTTNDTEAGRAKNRRVEIKIKS